MKDGRVDIDDKGHQSDERVARASDASIAESA
jgi:hypothetical protein